MKAMDNEQTPKVNTIEAVENALTFLESLGYKGGDIHDDLAAALNKLKERKAQRDLARKMAEDWSKSVHASFRMP